MPRELLNAIALALTVLVLATAGPWLVHEIATLPAPHALAARAGERVVVLDVGGMTCSGCARSVRGALAGVPGVSGVDVRRESGRALVVCRREVPDSALTAAVHRAGPGFLGAVLTR
jgi:copper chaperone